MTDSIKKDTFSSGSGRDPILSVRFYMTESGREPVKDWLMRLSREDRRKVGEDIKTIQFEWPVGMPLVRKMSENLWEIRSRIHGGSVRLFFTVDEKRMLLLHGFLKKSWGTPARDLDTAKQRLRAHLGD